MQAADHASAPRRPQVLTLYPLHPLHPLHQVLTIERLLPADYYTDGLVGVRVDSSVLVDLMQQRLPSLHQADATYAT